MKPFDRPHPIRANFGDPRTVFLQLTAHPLSGTGVFAFHDGIDIDAPRGTAVYPVVSGVVRPYHDRRGVAVATADGRTFVYMHIVPAVRPGEAATAGRTVLGHVRNWAKELHLTELAPGGAPVNPLLYGHLTPYADTTKPTIVGVFFWDERGGDLDSFALRGRIDISVEAYDTPMRVAATVPLSPFARDRFPVAPAQVSWSLARFDTGRALVTRRVVFDFRRGIPSNGSFWRVYKRGTYQNRAAIGDRLHSRLPGRYLYGLTPSLLDTRTIRDGVYVLTVRAVDVRGNVTSVEQRIEIRNVEFTP